jgi:hypothetical protein
MAAGMTVEQIAELQFAFPTFTEGVSMAAQKICRSLGIGSFSSMKLTPSAQFARPMGEHRGARCSLIPDCL